MSARSNRTNPPPEMLRTPPGYQDWRAQEKHDWIWQSLLGTTSHRPTDLPDLVMPFKTQPIRELGVVLRRRQLEKVLDRDGDLMEPGRPKIIHARGAVAMVSLDTTTDSPFTGLLGPKHTGGAIGLIRMSLVAKVSGKTAVTPALALKLLIDGRASADVLAMNHTVGQGRDFNPFSNTMTNDLTEEHKELRTPQKVMSVLFDRVSHQPRRLVSTHLASQRRDGSIVAEPVVPKRLVFHPTRAARALFAESAGVDFRLVLGKAEPEIELYDVEAISDNGDSETIGLVRTTSRFVSSDGGDRLYFRHVQDPADRKR